MIRVPAGIIMHEEPEPSFRSGRFLFSNVLAIVMIAQPV